MNKKLVLSVLSTAVVASMASAAMAKPPGPGFLVGGDVDKYYSLEAFLGDHFDEALDGILENLDDTYYVTPDRNIVGFIDAVYAKTAEDLKAKEVAPTKEHFGDNVYAVVGEEGEVWNPSTDPDLPGVPVELKVEGVSAITKTGVDVTFPATTDVIENFTIEVKDDKGQLVPVKPVNLVKGETVASFTFEKALTEDPKGVWTVAGITVDLDLKANLEAVYNYKNQVTLLEGLNKLGLTDVKAENIAFYQDELDQLKDATKTETYVPVEKFTKEVAQKVVTDGNAAAVKAGDAAATVKAVNDAKTQVALYNALAPFERVNVDWIADYAAAFATPYTEDANGFKAIQTAIDGVNSGKVDTAYYALNIDGTNNSIVKKDLTDAKALVAAYQKPDGEGETAKADRINAIDVQLAIVAVLEAQTPAQLTVAINGLKALDAAYVLNMDNFKDANRQAYIDAFKAETTVTNKNTIKAINDKLVAVNATKASAPIKAIEEAATAITDVNAVTSAQADALLKALKAYTDVKNVVDANKDFYAKLAVDPGVDDANKFSTLDPATDGKDEVQALVDEANLVAIDQAADADKTFAALKAYGNDIKDLSVNNKNEYHAAFHGNAVDAADVQGTVDAANIVALQSQTTAAGVLAKLNIMTQVKNVKAENAAAYLKSVQTTNGDELVPGVENLGDSSVDTVAEVQSAIDAINSLEAATSGVKAVNEAKTATELRDILTDLVVNGDITSASYLNLTNADKLLVAELFLNDDVFKASGLAGAARTNLDADKKYQALPDIETDLEKLAAAFDKLRTDMNTVFYGNAVGSVKIADVQAELAKLVKANYTAYDELTGTQKLAVAEAFIAAFPVNKDGDTYLAGYTTMGAYTAAVDEAIAASN